MTLSYEPKLQQVPSKVGLLVYGTITLLLGTVSLLTSLGLVVVLVAPKTEPPATSTTILGAITAVSLATSVFVVWLGLDMMRAKKWVRPVTIALAGYACLTGMASSPGAIFNHYTSRVQSIPATILATIALVVFGVLAPAAYFFFFARPSIAAVFSHFDPAPSRTDRYSLPVLSVAIIAGLRGVYGIGLSMVEGAIWWSGEEQGMLVFSFLEFAQAALSLGAMLAILRTPAWGWALCLMSIVFSLLVSVGEELLMPGVNHSFISALFPGAIPPMATNVMIQQVAGCFVYCSALLLLRRTIVTGGGMSM